MQFLWYVLQCLLKLSVMCIKIQIISGNWQQVIVSAGRSGMHRLQDVCLVCIWHIQNQPTVWQVKGFCPMGGPGRQDRGEQPTCKLYTMLTIRSRLLCSVMHAHTAFLVIWLLSYRFRAHEESYFFNLPVCKQMGLLLTSHRL